MQFLQRRKRCFFSLDPFSQLMSSVWRTEVMINIIIEMCILIVDTILLIFSVIVYVFSDILCINNYGFFFFFHCLSAMFIPIFSLKVALYIFLRLCLLYLKIFRLFMSWNVLLYPLLMPYSLDVIVMSADHRQFQHQNALPQAFLPFNISIEKAVILMGFPLYATQFFSLLQFSIHFLFCIN